MNKLKHIFAHVIIGISISSLFYVVMTAWIDPKTVMAFVHVDLPNNDALSSIRGIYGGAGLFILLLFIQKWRKDLPGLLRQLTVFWLLYAIARIWTLLADGPLGSFGQQWLGIETSLGLICWGIYFWIKPKTQSPQ